MVSAPGIQAFCSTTFHDIVLFFGVGVGCWRGGHEGVEWVIWIVGGHLICSEIVNSVFRTSCGKTGLKNISCYLFCAKALQKCCKNNCTVDQNLMKTMDSIFDGFKMVSH